MECAFGHNTYLCRQQAFGLLPVEATCGALAEREARQHDLYVKHNLGQELSGCADT